MESGSATQEFIPTHRLMPAFLGRLTRDQLTCAAALSRAVAKARGLMLLGVDPRRRDMFRMRLECGTEVSVQKDDIAFVPTRWIDKELLQRLPKRLEGFASLLRQAVSQGVVLAGSIGGNGNVRSRVRFATGEELEVPAWALTDVRPIEVEVIAPAAGIKNGRRKPPFVHNGGRFNGSRGR